MANAEQITAQILSTKSLCVSSSWLNQFLASSQRSVPTSALTKTALFRVLASDIRSSLAPNPTSLFPVDISDPAVQERRLPGPIPVQVLDIEDVGTSLWSQVEAIERVERGEAIVGREIIRTLNVDNINEGGESGRSNNTGTAGTPSTSRSSGSGPHRLILQDVNGTKAVAIEMQPIEGISLEKLPIGAKILLRNATVARGLVLLNPTCSTLLGGKIDALDKSWREGRKARLLQRINSMAGEVNQTN